MKNRSLRFKIALLVGIVLIIACLTLTVNSLYSARGYYGVLENETIVEALPDTVDTEKIVEGEIVLPDTPSPYSVATQQFSIQGIVVMIVAILLSLIAAYCLTGRLLVPLTILMDSIKKVNQERLNQRVELPNTTGEVKELAEAFNSMMDRLENSFQIQKNFAANAAHELKTPLAVLKTGLQVLEMEETPQLEDYREFTYAAKNSIDRLTGTVDALMTLAVSSDSSYTETVEILPLLKLVVNELKSKADEAEITVSVFGDCPKICAEQTLVYRAIFNLVENAIKYNSFGGNVKITLSEIENHGVMCIEDNGIGMPSEAVEYAFEPFYRADKSRSQEISGCGLGLSVVKTIAERFQWKIKLESKESVGTKITLIF